MLAWARREIGNVSVPATATANATGVTSLVLPAASVAAVSPLGTQQQFNLVGGPDQENIAPPMTPR
jgi:hypothetical protein